MGQTTADCLVLPASLTRLELCDPLNLPIPVNYLPIRLFAFSIASCRFNLHNLLGALPLTASAASVLFSFATRLATAQVPLLAVLCLGRGHPHQLSSSLLAPLTKLHVLRVGPLDWCHLWQQRMRRQLNATTAGWDPLLPGSLPASLRGLVVVTDDSAQPAECELAALTVSHPALAFEIQVKPRTAGDKIRMSALSIFDKLCDA